MQIHLSGSSRLRLSSTWFCNAKQSSSVWDLHKMAAQSITLLDAAAWKLLTSVQQHQACSQVYASYALYFLKWSCARVCRFIAALNVNQTTGPPNDNDWTWGRAFIDQNSTWQAFFPKAGVEWNVSRLVAPANFSILGGNLRSGDSGMQACWLDQIASHAAWQMLLQVHVP